MANNKDRDTLPDVYVMRRQFPDPSSLLVVKPIYDFV